MKQNQERQLTRLVDDIIKENRRQLEEIKNMRNHFINNTERLEDNKTNSSFRKTSSDKLNDNKAQTNDFQNYLDLDELLKHLNFINLKLERKKVKISQLKLQISSLYSQNHLLTEKLRENEEFRLGILEKLDLFETDLKGKEAYYQERESILVHNYNELEQEKMQLEEKSSKREKELINQVTEAEREKNSIQEKYSKINKDYDIKMRELEEMSKRVREIETFVEENNKNNGDYIKKMKLDVEDLKGKIYSYEKMIEIIIYFFKKISHNENETEPIKVSNFDISMLQQRLIELENTLIFQSKLIEKFHLTNEKNNDMLLQTENINNYLNEKMVEVKSENKVLKNQLRELLQLNKSLLYATSEISFKKSLETNPIPPLTNEKLSSAIGQIPVPAKSENSYVWKEKYINLEKRLYEIEKELINHKTENTQHSGDENENLSKPAKARVKSGPQSPRKEELNVDKMTENFNSLRKSSNFIFTKKLSDIMGDTNNNSLSKK